MKSNKKESKPNQKQSNNKRMITQLPFAAAIAALADYDNNRRCQHVRRTIIAVSVAKQKSGYQMYCSKTKKHE